MPPKKTKNVVVMVANVGSSSLDSNSLEDEPFLDKIKYSMKLLVEKKIFLQPKDEIGIITMGDKTENPYEIDNVKIYSEHLLVPNWEMIKYINNLTKTNFSCNWIETLHVALCFLREEAIEPSSQIFIVIFNNFKENAEAIDEYDPDNIIQDLNAYENLHILFVGESVLNESNPSEKFALSIIEKSDAQYENINDFIDARQFYIAPPVNPSPWKVNLEWAGLNIPCSTFVKVTDGLKLSSWKMQGVTADSLDFMDNNIDQVRNHTNVIKENIQMDIHRNEISQENIINGYKFGGKYIPFSDEDEIAMSYSGSQKSLKIYGFAPQTQIKLDYWAGKGSRIIVPQSSDNNIAFNSLVKTMLEENMAAIVRKVYQQNSLPRMGVLFPKVEENEIMCLIHLELPYIEDIRVVQKEMIHPGEKLEEKEKIDAVESFIESLTVNDELPYLNPGMFPNLRNQFFWNAVADRAQHPENPLLPVNNYIKKYLDLPEILKNKAQPHLEKLNELFGSPIIQKADSKIENPIASEDFKNIQTNTPLEPSFTDAENELTKTFFSPDDVDLKMEELEDF